MEQGIAHKLLKRSKPDEVSQDSKNEPSIQARFAAYDSPFFKLLAPMLTMRYLWLALEDINPKDFLRKPKPWEHADGKFNVEFKPWKKPDAVRYLSRQFTAFGIGGSVLAIMGYYTERTNHDIKTLYSEAVGYELNKKPQDVTMGDIYFKSQNEAVKVTRNAFIKRSIARFASGASFLVPWHMFRDFKAAAPKFDANTNMGVGIVGAYITTEAFNRKPSFFDAEQTLAATSIRHTLNSSDANVQKPILPGSIQTLLILQKQHLNKKYKFPGQATAEGQKGEMLSTRIADLMNQTYMNTPKTEDANFTIGKFNYLVGFGLLDKFPESLGFVELANRSTDLRDVKAAAAAIKSGQDSHAVFQGLGIDIDKLQTSRSAHAVAVEPTVRKFTDTIQPAKDRMPQTQRTHQDFAVEATKPNLAL